MTTVVLLLVSVSICALRLFTLYTLLRHARISISSTAFLRWGAVTVATLCLIAAAWFDAIRPSPASPLSASAASSSADTPMLNIFFVVDRSPHSWVDDFGPTEETGEKKNYRMTGIRADLHAIVHRFPDANYSIIGFSSQAHLDWPLSADRWSLEAFLQNYSAYPTTADALEKVNPTAAATLLERGLRAALSSQPQSHNWVFYLGEGQRGQDVAPTQFSVPTHLIQGGAVLGYGTPAGGHIPDHWDEQGQLVYLSDEHGVVTAAPDHHALQDIARQFSVPYTVRTPASPIVVSLPAIPDPASPSPPAGKAPLGAGASYYWLCTATAFVLLLVEVFFLTREYRLSRSQRLR